MQTLYVVMGTTGEYSDRQIWLVRAFTNEKEAQEYIINASQEAAEIFQQWEHHTWAWNNPHYMTEEEKKEHKTNKYDPRMKLDYTGTTYYLDTVELEGK